MVIFSFIVLILSIVYFCMDRAGKLDRQGIGRVLGYLAMPLLSALVICIGVMPAFGGFGDILGSSGFSDSDYSMTFDTGFLTELVISLAASVPVIILAAVGCTAAAAYERERAKQYGAYDTSAADRLLRMAVFAAGGGIAAGLASIIFGAASAVYAAGTAVIGMGAVVLGFMLLTLMTFGIGLILAVVGIPIYAVAVGIRIISRILPLLISMAVWGWAFCVLHIFAMVFGIFAVRRLSAAGLLPGKKPVLYGVLCAVPLGNIFCFIYLMGKVKAAKASM